MLRDNISELYSKSEDILFATLFLLASAIFLLQVQSLYATPIPDSYLWWGDESWLMIEFRNQIQHGMFAHPFALGSSLALGSGIIFNNMWMTALLYGMPAALIRPEGMDIVFLGRTITIVFALTLLVVLYEIVRNVTLEKVLAMFAVVLLLTSRSFLLTSHSARYDMLSALAILIGINLLLKRRKFTVRAAAIAGFVVAASMLVTIHVVLALSVAGIVIVIARSENKRGAAAGYVAGCVVFLVLIVLVSALIGQLPFNSPGNTGFALNLHDVPVLRLYSRSVQFANIAQRWNMFFTYARGFILTFVILFLFVILHAVRNRSLRLSLFSVAIAVLFLSWFELESAAPSSYLIYILPVLSLAATVIAQKTIPEALQRWVVTAIGIVLAILAFRDVPARHGKGYHMMMANSFAVSSALNEIESDTSVAHPLVLAFTPAVHEVMRDTNVRMMTTQFVEYPESSMNVDSLLIAQGVNYVLVYASAIKPDYMREVAPIRSALDRIATPVWERPGFFTDIGRSYFDTVLGLPDTLRLYHVHAP